MENLPGTPPPPPAGAEVPGVPAPQIVYLQPGQQVVYLQPPPGHPGQAYYQVPPYQYQQPYVSPAPLPPSSGFRISAGILGIALGVWNTIMFFAMMANTYGPSTPLVGFLNFFHLVGALAVLTLGILVIVKHRGRSKPIPAMLLGATALLIIVDIILSGASWLPGLAPLAIVGGLPAAALAVSVLVREGATAQRK